MKATKESCIAQEIHVVLLLAVSLSGASGPGPDLSMRSTSQHTRELKRSYSITASAVASSVLGTVRLSAFAVVRLMTSSYLVGACTGRLAGFSPLRMRSKGWGGWLAARVPRSNCPGPE